MKSLIAFWKKDIINKLIILVSLALIAGAAGMIVLVLNLPAGSSFMEAFTDFLPARPTATFDISVYLTPKTATPSPFTATPRPTIALVLTDTPVSPTVEQASPTFEASATVELSASPTSSPSAATSATAGNVSLPSCIPGNPSKIGNVIEILDGNTVRALIDGLVYTVRYIGVTAPTDTRFTDAARIKNRELVYGRAVTLIPDISTKDDRGRLLFYVLVGDSFINQKMIEEGLGLASDTPPNSACAPLFKDAQQKAINAQLGQWSLPTPTPRP